jgi:putative Mg2+ transporter-C (MgtC) family protein
MERQFNLHPAGLRTNAMVCLGAALFMSLSKQLVEDPTTASRIASYIVSGVGFLGGGAILKEGANVRGLTTAASLWCSAAVGTMCGSSHRTYALVGTVFVLGALVGLRPLSRWVDRRRKQNVPASALYRVKVVCQPGEHPAVRTVLARHLGDVPGFTVTGINTSKVKRKKQVVIVYAEALAVPANDRGVQDTISRLLIEPGVRSASWIKLPAPPE